MVFYPRPVEGAALLGFAPNKPFFNQTHGGNEFRRAPVNHKAINVMAQPRLATIGLPG